MHLAVDSIDRRVRITITGMGTPLRFYHRCNSPMYARLLAKDLGDKIHVLYDDYSIESIAHDFPGFHLRDHLGR